MYKGSAGTNKSSQMIEIVQPFQSFGLSSHPNGLSRRHVVGGLDPVASENLFDQTPRLLDVYKQPCLGTKQLFKPEDRVSGIQIPYRFRIIEYIHDESVCTDKCWE